MNASDAVKLVIEPTLVWLGDPYDSQEARVLLTAIGQTESAFRTRLQKPVAYARGWWQFEKNGGCAEFEQAKRLAAFRRAAVDLGFKVDRTTTWTALGVGADNLACIMARALLWLDPAALPAVGDVDAAYDYYVRRWRPGKPSKARFRASYATAVEANA